ncbi:MAG: hypothetical protein H5U20_07665 [Rhodobacteraceae bacterium]|nr:hypothetical protein [Paracoccaceae bacterium]MBC7157377.1 hypothetical protein [Paracoccaceae bacterium]
MAAAPTRARDEQVLEWLALAAAGHGWKAIGDRCGASGPHVMVTCRRVRDADLAESGEAADAVRAAYPVARPIARRRGKWG